MTITRLFQSGFELNNNGDDAGPLVTFTGAMAYEAGTVRTGTYSLLLGTDRYDFYYASTARAQVRFNMQFYWGGGTSSNGSPELFYCRTGGTERIRVKYNISGTEWIVWDDDGPPIELITQSYTFTVGWHRICCDIKLHASAGWVYLYIDNVPVIEFDGQTNLGGDTAEDWGIGPITGTSQWGSTEIIDDITLEDMTGETYPQDSEDRRYHFVKAANIGNYSQFTPSAGSNYQNVDEIPHDSNTTYNEANANGTKDSYVLQDYAIPAGRKVDAIIPLVVARKISGGDAVQIKPFARENGVDNASAAQSMTTSFEHYWHRIRTAPDGNPLYQDVINDMESGIEISV
jgi:hypothetical protein